MEPLRLDWQTCFWMLEPLAQMHNSWQSWPQVHPASIEQIHALAMLACDATNEQVYLQILAGDRRVG